MPREAAIIVNGQRATVRQAAAPCHDRRGCEPHAVCRIRRLGNDQRHHAGRVQLGRGRRGVLDRCVSGLRERPGDRGPTAGNFDEDGGKGSVTVTAPAGCEWTAKSTAGWITIDAGATGSGSGTLAYTVREYDDDETRTGTIIIAGHIFTVRQRGDD
jgi:hypothetical protein